MTEDELLIETHRYRAPAVVPLPNGRFAVLWPNSPAKITADLKELHSELEFYIQWNVLPPPQKRVVRAPKVLSTEDILTQLGLS